MSNFERLQQIKQSDIIKSFSFYKIVDNTLITNISHILINSMGEITTIIIINENNEDDTVEYNQDEFYYLDESLFVLGIGNLLPGDIVKLKHTDFTKYELNYGWHTNISNQTLYSWYLKPLNEEYLPFDSGYLADGKNITLYKEYLDTIEVVEYRRDRNYFYRLREV